MRVQTMSKSINDLISSFEIPDETTNKNLHFVRANVSSNQIFPDLNPKFFGTNIDDALPRFLKKSKNIIEQEQDFAKDIRTIFPKNTFSVHETEEISKKIFLYMKMYAYFGKKNIPIQDITSMISLLADSYTHEQVVLFGSVIRDKYTKLEKILGAYHRMEIFYSCVRNPNMLSASSPESSYHWGQGSYLTNGEWTYGKQEIPFITNVKAHFGYQIRHPHHNFEFSIIDDAYAKRYVGKAEFCDMDFIFDKNGLLEDHNRAKHQREIFLFVFRQIKNISNWQSYNAKNLHTMRCEIRNNRQEKIFSISCISQKNIEGKDESWKICFYDRIGKKIGEIVTDFNNVDFIKHIARSCASFISTYLLSEFCLYVYSATRGISLPHPAVCPPNGNPWTAMRLSGNISYMPSSSVGQLASKISVVQPSFFPTKSINPIAGNLGDVSSEKIDHLLNPNIWWETFQNNVIIKNISNISYRAEYQGSHFQVDVTKESDPEGFHVVLSNDSFEIIQELFVLESQENEDFLLGKLALGHALKINNIPEFQDYGYMFHSRELLANTKISPTPKSAIGYQNQPAGLSIPSVPISYAINDASTTLIKYGNSDSLNGNLTNFLDVFSKNELIDMSPEKNSINDYKTFFGKVCDFYESNFLSSTVQNQEKILYLINIAPIIHAIHQQALMAEDKMIVDQLPFVNEFGTLSDASERKKNFGFVTIQNQNFDFSYKVILTSERISLNTPAPSKIQKVVTSDFSKSYGFKIICSDTNKNTIFVYCPQRQFNFGNVDIFSNIYTIICGYLPDFILWVNSEGITIHKNMRISSVNSAKTQERLSAVTKEDKEEWNMPFIPDCTMMTAQYETVKSWLSNQFPSLKGMKQGPGHANLDVLAHSLNCATMVDVTRDDGYCPALETGDDRLARILRIAAILHDVGKSSAEDGGTGGISEDHPRYSSVLSQPLLAEFYLNKNEQNIALKLIRNHDIFGKAQTGKIGTIDDAIAHIAKIAGTQKEAELLYHLYRCDVDSIPGIGLQGKNVGNENSLHTKVNSENLLEMVINYINSNIFSAVKIEDVMQSESIMQNKKQLSSSEKRLSHDGEFVQKVNNLGQVSAAFTGERVVQAYNPQYFKKMNAIIHRINKNPELSFARELSMSYDGATGTIARCFFWTTGHSIQNIFSYGLKNYFGIDYAGIHALVNAPLSKTYSMQSMLGVYEKNRRIIDHRYLVVFDYHMGKIITSESLEKIAPIWTQWKSSKNGNDLLSLSINDREILDRENIALQMGYSTIYNNDKTIICADPNRIALIGAYEINSNPEGMAQDEQTSKRSHYGDIPATLEILLQNGHYERVTLPKLNYSEIFISTNHPNYFDASHWNGIPMQESTKDRNNDNVASSSIV